MSKKAKKASVQQKEYLLNYMETHQSFANEKFGSGKWIDLTNALNSLGGAMKNEQQWRKFWIDQKIIIREKKAVLRASYEGSEDAVSKSMRPLTEYETRVLQLMVPTVAFENVDVPSSTEIWNNEETLKIDCIKEEYSMDSFDCAQSTVSFDNQNLKADQNNSTSSEPSTLIKNEVPETVPKRRTRPSVKNQPTGMEERLLQIEEEKLKYMQKEYDLKRQKFEADERWRENFLEIEKQKLDIEKRKIYLEEKKLEYKTSNKM